MKRLFVLAALLLVGLASAQTTLFTQDFDGAWSTNNPPAGWVIRYDGQPSDSLNHWHKEPYPGSVPWSGNSTGYAAIIGSFSAVHADTLISPAIDCSQYRNVALRCSTYFLTDIPAAWTAQIQASGDSGVTWTVVRDYISDFGPQLETFDISSIADLQSRVMLRWVWNGDISKIRAWCLDNVSITGTFSYANDIASGAIRRPRRNELPFPSTFRPRVNIQNVGTTDAFGVEVKCDIVSPTTPPIVIYTNTQSNIDLPRLSAPLLVVFDPVNTPLLVADTGYHVYFTINYLVDENPLNDTSHRRFNVALVDYVYYDDSTASDSAHWTYANSGWGLRLECDTTPAQLLDARVNLHVPTTGGPYYYKLRLVDDDGPDNAPGTTLYESGLLTGTEGWNTTDLSGRELYLWHDTVYLFYIQPRDWPDAPELNHDIARNDSASYWNTTEGTYSPDMTDGDWMIRCHIDYAPPALGNLYDAQAMYVAGPDDELTLRPAGVSFAPEARIVNVGREVVSNIPVRCTVYTLAGTVVYSADTIVPFLGSEEGTVVSFPPWTPDFVDTAKVVVRTALPGDVYDANDTASKKVFIYASHFTGSEVFDRYAWIDSDTAGGPTYSWIDTNNFYLAIHAPGSQRARIPFDTFAFSFPYRDSVYKMFWICNNGWLSLGMADPLTSSYNNLVLPSVDAPHPALFPFWDELSAYATSRSGVYWNVLGSAPNRRLVVTWQNMQPYGTPDTTDLISFQAVLEEANGFVTFQYRDVTGGAPTRDYGRSATVGIQNKDGTRGLQYLEGDSGLAGYYPGNKLTPGRAILFYPMRRDVGVSQIVAPNGYVNPGPIVPQVKIRNSGSFPDPFYAKFRVMTQDGGTQLWADSILISSMRIGAESLLTFQTWTAFTGAYLVKCSTALDGDINPANNQLATLVYAQPWLQKKDVPVGVYNRRVRYGALAYLEPYIYAFKGANTNEFLRYDLSTDAWDTLPSLPAGPRNKRTKDGCGLTIGDNTVYALKGGNTREFYSYDIGTNTWRTRDSLQWGGRGARNGTSIVYTPSKIYALAGGNTNAVMSFDLALDTWRMEASIEGGSANIRRKVKRGASISYDGSNTLYAFKGGSTTEFWKYSIVSQRWDTGDSVPLGLKRKKVKSGASSAYLAGVVYLLKGGNTTEFWAFDVARDTWTVKSDIPLGAALRRVKPGGAMVAGGSQIYALKGGNKVEFWAYGSGFDTLFSLTERKISGQQGGITKARVSFACRVSPNPFTGSAAIRLALPEATYSRLRVYDVTGKLVATLLDGNTAAGIHDLAWNGRDLSNREVACGIYVMKLEASDYHATQKLILER